MMEMKLSDEVKKSIDKCILCWLATVSSEGIPNVSPKEVFMYYSDEIIIANIASPQTVKNIKSNNEVCISFIDILVQKGFQVKGKARIISKSDEGFSEREKGLLQMTEGKFPFSSITSISPDSVKPIIAPRYLLYPETTEEEQVQRAKAAYGIS